MAISPDYGTNPRRRFPQALGGNRRAPHLNFSPNPIAMSPQIHTYTEPRQLWAQGVIPQRPPFLLTHVKQVVAIIALLAFLFGLWFGVSTHHAPQPSYPYYDTQKPVPPWSEPAPLEGNHDREGAYR
jgi:hypothetical protein